MSGEALRVAREAARLKDPTQMARLAGAVFEGGPETGTFELRFFGQDVRLSWPQLEVIEPTGPLPDHMLALIVYYLSNSDGTAPTGQLTCFADLPDGRFYAQAFRGYTGAPLVRSFAADPDALVRMTALVDALPVSRIGDRAWFVPALPRVPLTLVWWDSDDEFEARAEIMFDTTALHHVTIDGCALLGSWLTSLLRV